MREGAQLETLPPLETPNQVLMDPQGRMAVTQPQFYVRKFQGPNVEQLPTNSENFLAAQ